MADNGISLNLSKADASGLYDLLSDHRSALKYARFKPEKFDEVKRQMEMTETVMSILSEALNA